MAATSTKAADTGLSFDTEESVPKQNRGRGLDQTTIAIRDELKKSQKDGKARSFKNVTKDERETYARKVRAAGKALDMATSTIFDEEAKKLYWGPADVIKKLQASTNS